MSTTYTTNIGLNSSAGGSSLSGQCIEVGNLDQTINTQLPAGTTNQSFTLAITAANLQAIELVASQNCTIKANSTSTPAYTINLVAGRPLYWGKSDGYYSNPITADTTVWYLTSTAAVTLKGKVLTS